MKESQQEIKAIQAKLRSIRVNPSSHPHTGQPQTSPAMNRQTGYPGSHQTHLQIHPLINHSVNPQVSREESHRASHLVNYQSVAQESRPVSHQTRSQTGPHGDRHTYPETNRTAVQSTSAQVASSRSSPPSASAGVQAMATMLRQVTQLESSLDPSLDASPSERSPSTFSQPIVAPIAHPSQPTVLSQPLAPGNNRKSSPISSDHSTTVQSSSASQPIPPASIDLPPIHPSGSATPRSELNDGVDWEPIQVYAHRWQNTGERLHQKSVQCLQQLAQPAPDRPEEQLNLGLQRLEAQAQHINQLAATQEAAILELKAIADQLEQDWKAIELFHAAQSGYEPTDIEIPSLCEYSEVSVPKIDKNRAGVMVLSVRSVDLFKAEREAALTAQALRHRSFPYPQRQRSWAGRLSQWLLGAHSTPALHKNGSATSGTLPNRKRKARGFNRREALTLFVGAVVVRVLLNLLLSAHPGLWFPAIAIMVTPGAIALYRSSVTPRSTLTWGYRFIVIMIGFWIGGRLFI